MSLPVYQPTVGAMCPHGEPDCLCDVHITTHTVVNRDVRHDFHTLVLDDMDDDWVSTRNIYEFLCKVLGCFEYVKQLDNPVVPLRNCVVCNNVLPDNDSRRTTCSGACRSRKSRADRKASR